MSKQSGARKLTFDVLLGLSLRSMGSTLELLNAVVVLFFCFRFLDLDLERDLDRAERDRPFFFFLRGEIFSKIADWS